MEQSDQPQQELILATPSQLTLHQKDASQNIASLVVFMEFLQELQQTIKKEEPKKRNKDYYLHCNFGSGQYTSGRQTDDKTRLEIVLEYLTKLIQDTLQSTSSLMKGKKILLDGDSVTLFSYLACYLGFYNFLPNYNHDKYCFSSDLANFCLNTFYVLYEPSPLTLPDWEMLHRAATMRVRERLRYLYYQNRYETYRARDPKSNNDILFVKLPDGRPDMNQPLYYTDINLSSSASYSYFKNFELDEIEHHVSLIVAEEEERLKGFVEALHGTLKVLASVTASKKPKTASQETDILKMLQSLFAMLSQPETMNQHSPKASIVEGTLAASPTQRVNIKKVEHKGQSHIYHLVLTDPDILPEPCEFTLTYNEGSSSEEVSLQEAERDE